MKRTLICIILILSILMLAGCRKEEIFITSDDIINDTMLIKRNGSMYVAIVEDFDKSYYNLSELNEFVTKEVNAYNNKVGSEEVTIEELELKNGKAVLILKYTKMAHYSAFNNMPAAYFSADTENVALELPTSYVDAKKDIMVDKDVAMKNDKNKVLVIYEPYEVIVEGKIKFYSDNAKYIDENKVSSNSEDMAVIIFRP
ncbi:MAG: hypothetical protein GX379_07325 [Clostridiales bacterium]|jgi:hypothetical protein|nr:hypothetical protein [Clostridiales bacterium]